MRTSLIFSALRLTSAGGNNTESASRHPPQRHSVPPHREILPHAPPPFTVQETPSPCRWPAMPATRFRNLSATSIRFSDGQERDIPAGRLKGRPAQEPCHAASESLHSSPSIKPAILGSGQTARDDATVKRREELSFRPRVLTGR